MTTHVGRAFLNSCLKVPLDPCNNCPAPIYNRPKMYLGRLTTTPMSTTAKMTTATTFKTTDVDDDAMWTVTGVRSLAKLYDSIPDYADIHHLPNEEFYSTLDTLRTSCCQLRTKPFKTPSCVLEETSLSTTSGSSLLVTCEKKKKTKKKSKCSAKKKRSPSSKDQENKYESQRILETPCNVDCKMGMLKNDRMKSFKENFDEEIKAFKKTLKDFEEELKQRSASVSTCRRNEAYLQQRSKREEKNETFETLNDAKRVPVKSAGSCFREYLKKSFSFNDIHSIADSKDNNDNNKIDKQFSRLSKAESLAFKDSTKLSNYFMAKKPERRTPSEGEIPKIIVDSPSTETMSTQSSHSTSGRKKKSRSKRDKQEQFKLPFTLFELSNSLKKENSEQTTPSPVHPVARPNLAATLRAEVSKKKLKELKNNCTYHDTTPQFDWEVRKTPAWKTLSLNESHKEILSLRLATRKAEQALQRREYELNMELMRQRVKSAPLLLEGTTYWGPYVGKLTHTCPSEGLKHACQSIQRRQRKKGVSNSLSAANSECAAVSSRMSQKLQTLRKIYGSSAKSLSRNSQQGTTSRASAQKQQKSMRQEQATQQDAPDDDDLSSLDRAYL